MRVDGSCVVATILFTTANVLRIVQFANWRKRSNWDHDLQRALDPEYLDMEWDYRLSRQGLWYASSFINAISWIVFVYPIIQLAWVLSHNGTKGIMVNVGIVVLCLSGAFMEWMANLFYIGMSTASKQLVTQFNIYEWVRNDVAGPGEGLGLRCLEINHIVGRGFLFFVDSIEWICIGGVFLLTYISVGIWRRDDKTSFGTRWNSLGLFIGLFCLLEFVVEVLRMDGVRSLTSVSIAYSSINRLILMPSWMLGLAFMLPRAALKQAYTDVDPIAAELALTELSSPLETEQTNPEPENKFSIDDGEGDENGTPASPPPEAFAPPPTSSQD